MILYIDKGLSNWIKFIAAIMVIIHHYSQYALSELGLNNIILRVFSFMGGYLGVAIFFFLSGYGLMMSNIDRFLSPKEFIRKRVGKIYSPVLLATALWLIIVMSIQYLMPSNRLLSLTGINDLISTWGGGISLIYSVLHIPLFDGVLWFVKVLFLLYLTFLIFSILYRKKEIMAWITLFIITIFITVFSSRFWGTFTAYSIPLFSIGVFIAAKRNITYKIFNVGLIPIFIYVIISFFIHWPKITLINSAFCCILVIICTKWKIKISCPAIIATISFDLYLIHNKVLMLGRSFMGNFPLLLFLIITGVSVLLWHLVQSNKVYLKSIVNQRNEN